MSTSFPTQPCRYRPFRLASCFFIPASEFAAQDSELLLLRLRENVHLRNDPLRVIREQARDQAASPRGEPDRIEPAVLGFPLPGDEAPFFEIIDHHRDIAAAFEDLSGQFALAERAQMVQGLQDAELADGESGIRQVPLEACGYRPRRPYELDVGVQRPGLFFCALEIRGHIVLIINNLT